MILPTWLLAIGKGLLGFLRGVPWQVYAGLALIAALWWWGNSREAAGRDEAVAACNEAIHELRAEAIRRIQAEQAKSRALEQRLRQRFADLGEAARIEIRAEFEPLRERVIRESHALVVPDGCPVSPVASVREALQAATNRANTASGSL